MKELLKLFKFLKPYKGKVGLSVMFSFLFVIFGLFSVTMLIPFLGIIFDTKELVTELPEFKMSTDYFFKFVNFHLSKVIIKEGPRVALMFICALIFVMTFFKTLFRYLSVFFMAPVRNGVVKDIRNKLFTKIIHLPLSFYSEEKKGDIMSRMTVDVKEVEVSIVNSIETFLKDPITIIIHVIVLFSLSTQLSLFVIILLPISGWAIGRLGKSLRRKSARGQEKMGVILSQIEETIGGLRIIKAFNAEKKTVQRFFSVNSLYTRIMNKIFRRRGLAGPMSEFLGTLVMISILLYGSNLVLGEPAKLEPQELIGYLAIFYMIISPAKSFSTAYYNIQKGLAASDRINNVLKAKVTIKDSPGAKPVKGFNQSIEFKDVYFRYDQDHVLKNINIKVEKGKTYALVGQSGSGKTTLANLLPRLLDVEEGAILFDGVPLKELKIKELRDLMGVVTQESILFNDTVFNNIAFGYQGDADEKGVVEAAKVANAHDFIMKMKLQYHTNIGDSGNKLSGGQKQRLSIARAVLKNPPILILDEATSALDTEAEKLVQEALFNLMKNRTSIVIAHRLSTIKNADVIFVFQDGEIIERGNYQELLALDGVFKSLHEKQYG